MKRRTKLIAFTTLTAAIFTLLVFAIRSDWSTAVVASCVFYALIVSVFLAAQVFGFIASHTHYSESIEAPKFRMLQEEEAEWAKS
ncbi:MAG: hypothetical protein H6617_03070 [Bdellovibrionaceae bacterium]|nr:hypothetical protein [Bdellovibrionales bacterium]MCB9253641.1 hypothetical protein [Pseudobdellovibrionaceae bacterium]